MTNKENGGSAFPNLVETLQTGDIIRFQPGMTLRDWFAGQAISGVCSPAPDGWSLSPQDHAAWAYQIADAMMEARK